MVFLVTYRENGKVELAGIYDDIDKAEKDCNNLTRTGHEGVAWEPWPLNELFKMEGY